MKHVIPTMRAPTSYKWSYNPHKWPYQWVTGVITLLIGVVTPFINGTGPPCMNTGLPSVGFAYLESYSEDGNLGSLNPMEALWILRV